MELYQLRTFVAVAEEGHLTRAAEKLFISQPAVSAHVKALEEELGVALFLRSARGMQLTREGAALKAQAEAALKSVGELLSQARALRQGRRRTKRVRPRGRRRRPSAARAWAAGPRARP